MRHVSLIIRDYDHFQKNQKEFDLSKSYAIINNERIEFDKIKQVQNNSDGDGLIFNNVNINRSQKYYLKQYGWDDFLSKRKYKLINRE